MHSEAPDGGLYMPKSLPKIPGAIFSNIAGMSLSDISYLVANALFSPDIPSGKIKIIGEESLNFPIPLVKISDGIYALELFHGPTGTIKDVCSRFFARLLSHFGSNPKETLHVLVATNGNSGSAFAKAISEIPGVKFHILYPKDTLPELIRNIVGQNPMLEAVPVDGTIDDCRRMISSALVDKDLNDKVRLTSANAFNIGIVLPQIIYYFHAWAQLKRICGNTSDVWFGVPCGNGGGLLAGYMAMLMGLPAHRLVASCNANDAMGRFFSGRFPKEAKDFSKGACPGNTTTIRTLAYAMDTSCPSNIPRFLAIGDGGVDEFDGKICTGKANDSQILETIGQVKDTYGYELDPHGAVAYRCLADNLPVGSKGIVIASRKPSPPKAVTLSYAQLAGLSRIKPIAATYPALKRILTRK